MKKQNVGQFVLVFLVQLILVGLGVMFHYCDDPEKPLFDKKAEDPPKSKVEKVAHIEEIKKKNVQEVVEPKVEEVCDEETKEIGPPFESMGEKHDYIIMLHNAMAIERTIEDATNALICAYNGENVERNMTTVERNLAEVQEYLKKVSLLQSDADRLWSCVKHVLKGYAEAKEVLTKAVESAK